MKGVAVAVLLALLGGSVCADEKPAAPAAVLTPDTVEPPPRPLRKKPLFWIALVSGAGLVAAGIAVAVKLGVNVRDPMPTLGTGVGN